MRSVAAGRTGVSVPAEARTAQARLMASSPAINQFNEQLRASPQYAAWMRAQGIDPSKPIRLSDSQRKAFATYLASHGVALPRGAEIDPAGNANEGEGFGKQAKRWGPVVGAAALAAFGIPGVMPGLFTGGATAAGATAAGTGAATAGKFLGLGTSDLLTAALFGGQTLANVWGTKQQVGATDRAAEAQLQANREALDFLKQQWETARADFQPWLTTGTTATNKLNESLTNMTAPGLPAKLRQRMEGGYDPQTGRLTPTPAPTTLSQFNQPGGGINLSKRPDNVSTTMPVPVPRQPRLGNEDTLADFNRTPVSSTQPVRDSRLVRVQAPDGEIRELPLVQAARAMQLGARRVA